jgi:D-alanyl-D-alanine dipeptidase
MPALMLLLQTLSVAQTLAQRADLVDAASVVPGLQVELRYAGADNFMHEAVYGDLAVCYLAKDAAQMLARAAAALAAAHPDLRLHVWDCARPASIQRRMWAIVKGTPAQPYVADPAKGSIHGYGCAVDITVASAAGAPLDMGTPHDFFGRRAEPSAELELLERGELRPEQVANRLILREAMLRAGFHVLANEWWHFDCATQAETRRRFRMIE